MDDQLYVVIEFKQGDDEDYYLVVGKQNAIKMAEDMLRANFQANIIVKPLVDWDRLNSPYGEIIWDSQDDWEGIVPEETW